MNSVKMADVEAWRGERLYWDVASEEDRQLHLSRYQFARELFDPQWQCLDAACGSGYGSSFLAEKVRSVNGVDVDPGATDQVIREWTTWGGRAKLIVLPSPYRSVMEPLLEYIEQVENERHDDYVTVILPEFVPARWWQHLLHNQRALLIKGALLFRPNTVVTSVPFHLAK